MTTDTTTEDKVAMTNEELTVQLSRAIQTIESLRQETRETSRALADVLTYLEELDSVTFIALYLWTGKMRKTDIGKISNSRITQANALRINGRRALGEHRESERVKELRATAAEMEPDLDKDMPLEEVEKIVNSEKARLAAVEEQQKREGKNAVSHQDS